MNEPVRRLTGYARTATQTEVSVTVWSLTYVPLKASRPRHCTLWRC